MDSMKNKKQIDMDRQHRLNYRVTPDQYEFLARLAFEMPRGSIQKVIDSLVFERTWRKELDILRVKHKKLGLKDRFFYQPRVAAELGYKARHGRPLLARTVLKKMLTKRIA